MVEPEVNRTRQQKHLDKLKSDGMKRITVVMPDKMVKQMDRVSGCLEGVKGRSELIQIAMNKFLSAIDGFAIDSDEELIQLLDGVTDKEATKQLIDMSRSLVMSLYLHQFQSMSTEVADSISKSSLKSLPDVGKIISAKKELNSIIESSGITDKVATNRIAKEFARDLRRLRDSAYGR